MDITRRQFLKGLLSIAGAASVASIPVYKADAILSPYKSNGGKELGFIRAGGQQSELWSLVTMPEHPIKSLNYLETETVKHALYLEVDDEYDVEIVTRYTDYFVSLSMPAKLIMQKPSLSNHSWALETDIHCWVMDASNYKIKRVIAQITKEVKL